MWTVSKIAEFIGAERGTVRRWILRGRLSVDILARGARGSYLIAATPEFRFQLEALRDWHNRPSKKWQAATTSRRGRIEKLAAICAGELATDNADRLAAADVLGALALLWERQVGARDCPALRGALDFAPVVRSRAGFGDERIFTQLCQAAGMLQKSNGNALPEK